MRATLILELALESGALVRALALVERRGHRVIAVTTTCVDAHHRVVLEVETGDRSLELLVRQLERLLDVRSASVPAAGEPG